MNDKFSTLYKDKHVELLVKGPITKGPYLATAKRYCEDVQLWRDKTPSDADPIPKGKIVKYLAKRAKRAGVRRALVSGYASLSHEKYKYVQFSLFECSNSDDPFVLATCDGDNLNFRYDDGIHTPKLTLSEVRRQGDFKVSTMSETGTNHLSTK